MKVLWLTNIMPGFLANKLNLKTSNNLGWLDHSAEMLLTEKDITLHLLFPSDNLQEGQVDSIAYTTFSKKYTLKRDDLNLSAIFVDILKRVQPDVIHIYGTEYFHTVAMAKAVNTLGLKEKTVISIQGLVSVYDKHYMAGLPHKIQVRYTLRDLLKGENLVKQQKNFTVRGNGETDALRLVDNVIGRTEWDKACTKQINENSNYYFCNETLRKEFYVGEWSYENCQPHSVFVSQSSYSIKGLHILINCFNEVLKKFPDAKIYVTGKSVFNMKFYRINSYHKYLKELILKNNLKDKVIFLGSLNSEKMKQQFLDCNVFVMPSSVENSPNSLGEAMILGVPCIAADVGGISSVFNHGNDGFLYPFDADYMLAHYIIRIFEETDTTVKDISNSAKVHAQSTHNAVKNKETLIAIYKQLSESKG